MAVATFDPTADFASVVDGLEAVTLMRRGTSTTDAVANALRRAVTLKEASASGQVGQEGGAAVAGDGKYTMQDVVWHLPIEELATRPRLGDVIKDSASERWTVLEVIQQTLLSRWRCVTRNLAIVYGLDDTLTIEKATYAKGTAGASVRTWAVWRTGVRARLQPMDVQPEITAGTRRSEKTFTAWLAIDYPIDDTHRLRDAEGNYYRIAATSDSEALGQLQKVEVAAWRLS